MLGPYPDALSEWGSKNAVLILSDGEYYRLVTPIFCTRVSFTCWAI
jgi:hypothetical protein